MEVRIGRMEAKKAKECRSFGLFLREESLNEEELEAGIMERKITGLPLLQGRIEGRRYLVIVESPRRLQLDVEYVVDQSFWWTEAA